MPEMRKGRSETHFSQRKNFLRLQRLSSMRLRVVGDSGAVLLPEMRRSDESYRAQKRRQIHLRKQKLRTLRNYRQKRGT